MSYGMNNSSGVMSGQGRTGNKVPKGHSAGQLQQFTPEQMELFKNAFSHLGPDSFLSKLASGDQSQFEQMEAPAHRQFNEALGNISSRFSAGGGGQGSLGARKSSGFQNTTSSAASNFAENLQSQRMDYQRQALKDLMGLSNELLGQRPYEQFLVKKQKKQGMDWGGLAGGALGGIGGFLAGGPAGAVSGAGLGYNALSSNGGGSSNEDISNFASNFMR